VVCGAKNGRPFDPALAAKAAKAIRREPAEQLVFLALGNLLREAAVHGNRYDLGEADLRHLKVVEAAYLEHKSPFEIRPRVCAVRL
jgi:hypothetical protein